MARLFDDAASEYLQIEQAVVGIPLAMACFFNINDGTNSQALINIVDKDVDVQQLNFYTDSFQLVTALVRDAGGGSVATASVTHSINAWHHGCAIFVTTTDRRAFLNGANKGTNATSITPINLNRTSIGRRGTVTPAVYISGMIAEAAIWDLSQWPGATASDKADNFEKILPSLADNFTPDNYPLGLVAYWPLVRGLNDKVDGYNMTASGTVVAAHPRVIQPHGSF